MTKAAMKNDTFHSDLATALDDICIEARRVHTMTWMLSCTVEAPAPAANKQIELLDAVFLAMEFVDRKVSTVDSLATTARAQLHERMYPKAS